jgi:hypothetical protein
MPREQIMVLGTGLPDGAPIGEVEWETVETVDGSPMRFHNHAVMQITLRFVNSAEMVCDHRLMKWMKTLADEVKYLARFQEIYDLAACSALEFTLLIRRRRASQGGSGKLVGREFLASVSMNDADVVLDAALATPVTPRDFPPDA